MSTAEATLDLNASRRIAEQLLTPWAQGAPVTDVELLAIERFLRLERRHGDGFAIARRLIMLQQSVLLSKNLSVFF